MLRLNFDAYLNLFCIHFKITSNYLLIDTLNLNKLYKQNFQGTEEVIIRSLSTKINHSQRLRIILLGNNNIQIFAKFTILV